MANPMRTRRPADAPYNWTRHFAWRPIRVPEGWRWLCIVERRLVPWEHGMAATLAGYDWPLEYRDKHTIRLEPTTPEER